MVGTLLYTLSRRLDVRREHESERDARRTNGHREEYSMTRPQYTRLATSDKQPSTEDEAWRIWQCLESMGERARTALLEDKDGYYWSVPCPLNMACWICSRFGFSILYDHPRFREVPVPRVHNFYRNARQRAKTSEVGVWRYRDNWTMQHNPDALAKMLEIRRDMMGG